MSAAKTKKEIAAAMRSKQRAIRKFVDKHHNKRGSPKRQASGASQTRASTDSIECADSDALSNRETLSQPSRPIRRGRAGVFESIGESIGGSGAPDRAGTADSGLLPPNAWTASPPLAPPRPASAFSPVRRRPAAAPSAAPGPSGAATSGPWLGLPGGAAGAHARWYASPGPAPGPLARPAWWDPGPCTAHTQHPPGAHSSRLV
jgi:hypothetical protein